MQKIGLNICKNTNIKYYKKVLKSDFINLNDIFKISSISIECRVIDFSHLKENNFVKIFLNVDLKIFYSLENNSSINLFEKNTLTTEYVLVDYFIDGNVVNNNFLRTKFIFEVFVEDIFAKIIDKNTIFYSYHLILNLKINPSFYLCFLIENGLSNNLYLSYSDSTNLTQKTFDNNLSYDNIIFSNNLYFVGSVNLENKQTENLNHSLIYEVNNQNKINSFSNIRNVDSFCFKGNSQIIVSLNINNVFSLFIYDINTRALKKIPTPPISKSFRFPFFDKNTSNIYFICEINNINSLCYFDKNFKLNMIYCDKNVKWFKISDDKILFETDAINIFYKDFSISNEIIFNFEYENILKIDFFYESSLLILYSINQKNNLIIYNIDTFEVNELCPFFSVNDFDIDKNTFDIFFTYTENNFSQVIKIDKDLNEYYLENLSGKISKIIIKTI